MAKEYKDLVVGLDIGPAKVMAGVAEVLPGGELRVAGATGIVAEIAHSSQIPRIVPFHTTVEDAVANFAKV